MNRWLFTWVALAITMRQPTSLKGPANMRRPAGNLGYCCDYALRFILLSLCRSTIYVNHFRGAAAALLAAALLVMTPTRVLGVHMPYCWLSICSSFSAPQAHAKAMLRARLKFEWVGQF